MNFLWNIFFLSVFGIKNDFLVGFAEKRLKKKEFYWSARLVFTQSWLRQHLITMRVNYCCCCFDLEKGGTVLGWLELVGSVVSFLASLFLIIEAVGICKYQQTNVTEKILNKLALELNASLAFAKFLLVFGQFFLFVAFSIATKSLFAAQRSFSVRCFEL